MKCIPLIGRILYSAIFLLTFYRLFTKVNIDHATDLGLPMAYILVPIAGVLSFFGALSILLGYRAKIGAWILVVFLIPVTITEHPFWGIHSEPITEFLKNMSLLGAALMIAYFGSGPYSMKPTGSER